MRGSNGFYCFAKAICMPVFKLIYRYKFVNKNNFPKDGGYIVACNHISLSDPILLGLGQKRRIFFMAKDELFKNKLFGAILKLLGAFPVKRGADQGRAIKNGIDLITEGNVMGIFLEGARSKTGDFMRPRSGCALVAMETQVPVIPACITNVGKNKIFGKRIIHYGEPLTIEELGLVTGDRRELREATTTIMNKIKELREQDINAYKSR